ncbi:1-phosphofructokinase [Lacticaseibacillus absianus]|uniref:1-phosphofructokinase n=1 Tax=Lacticaseibacillus absianus TaxID=2729623 RepID=UPI0015CBE270|nr:1-phosphofructokinase [Lacticaseibacillus absianus]
MIYTLTLNPAIDLFITTPQMKEGTVNRTTGADVQANGKGVNVSFILHRLGIENQALGIGGGFTLAHIVAELTRAGIANDFIDAGGITRINVFTHVSATNEEFKLVNPGPAVGAAALRQLLERLERLGTDDTLILSGSFAQGIRPEVIVTIAQLSAQRHFGFVIDTSYPEVLDALQYHPLLIKPNDNELASWVGEEPPRDTASRIAMAKQLIDRGAQNVLLSCGEDGAIFVGQAGCFAGNAPKIAVLNTAGAGDTMLGTFVGGWVAGRPVADNLREAIAAGSDTARRSWLTTFEDLDDLRDQIVITREEA